MNLEEKLLKTNLVQLRLYDERSIPSKGSIKLSCSRNNILYKMNFHVVDYNVQPILGAQTCVENKFITINDHDLKNIRPSP